jgi:GTPase Era involved in 16S rRNA processing
MPTREQIVETYKFLKAARVSIPPEIEDRYKAFTGGEGIAIIGLLKRGKSTILNSIIGENVSPTGVAPETWCAVHISSGTPEAHFLDLRDNPQPLPHSPREFQRAVSRNGVVPSTTESVAIRGHFRLPNDLTLVDTPGINEQDENVANWIERLDRSWRKNGAIGAVLVTSYPPGVSRNDLLLFEKMRRHFGQSICVVMKGVDSSLSAEDLNQAAQVWRDLNVEPIQILDSRTASNSAWGEGPYALLEQAITSLNSQSPDELEKVANALGKSFDELIKEISQDGWVREFERDLAFLKQAIDLPLTTTVKVQANKTYAMLFESRVAIQTVSFGDLFEADRRGSSMARQEINSRINKRLNNKGVPDRVHSSGDHIDEILGPLVPYLDQAYWKKLQPTRLPHNVPPIVLSVVDRMLEVVSDPFRLIKLSLQDIKHICNATYSRSSIYADGKFLVVLQDAMIETVQALTSEFNIHEALHLNLPPSVQQAAIQHLFNLVRKPSHVSQAQPNITQNKTYSILDWTTITESNLHVLNQEVELTLKYLDGVMESVATETIVPSYFSGQNRSSFTSGKLHSELNMCEYLLQFMSTGSDLLSEDNWQKIDSLHELHSGEKGLQGWVLDTKFAHLKFLPILQNLVLFHAITVIALFVVLINSLVRKSTNSTIPLGVGVAFFLTLFILDRFEVGPVRVLTFSKYQKSARLPLRLGRRAIAEILALALVITLAVTLWKPQQQIAEVSSTSDYVSRPTMPIPIQTTPTTPTPAPTNPPETVDINDSPSETAFTPDTFPIEGTSDQPLPTDTQSLLPGAMTPYFNALSGWTSQDFQQMLYESVEGSPAWSYAYHLVIGRNSELQSGRREGSGVKIIDNGDSLKVCFTSSCSVTIDNVQGENGLVSNYFVNGRDLSSSIISHPDNGSFVCSTAGFCATLRSAFWFGNIVYATVEVRVNDSAVSQAQGVSQKLKMPTGELLSIASGTSPTATQSEPAYYSLGFKTKNAPWGGFVNVRLKTSLGTDTVRLPL